MTSYKADVEVEAGFDQLRSFADLAQVSMNLSNHRHTAAIRSPNIAA